MEHAGTPAVGAASGFVGVWGPDSNIAPPSPKPGLLWAPAAADPWGSLATGGPQ